MSKNPLKENIMALHHSIKSHIVEQLFQEHEITSQHIQWADNYLEEINVFVHCSAAIACAGVGGDMTKAIPLITSWYLFVMAADVYDDIQDGETEAYAGADDETLSFALFLVALSYQALCQLDVPLPVYRKIERKMRSAYLSAASGQLHNQTVTLEAGAQRRYLTNITAISATPIAQYYACGVYLVPIVNEDIAKSLYEYGNALGICSQLKDDLEDLQADLKSEEFTLPILHGLAQHEHPLFQELQKLMTKEVKSEGEISRIIEILQRMGSLENVKRLMMVYMQSAKSAIASISHLLSADALELLSWKKE